MIYNIYTYRNYIYNTIYNKVIYITELLNKCHPPSPKVKPASKIGKKPSYKLYGLVGLPSTVKQVIRRFWQQQKKHQKWPLTFHFSL